MEKTSRAYHDMMRVARERLEGKDPKEISKKSKIPFDEQQSIFQLNCLGIPVTVRYPGYEIESQLDEWMQFMLLHYMDMADGAPQTDEWQNMAHLKDGLVRGGRFDRQCEMAIQKELGNYPPEVLQKVCQELGATLTSSNADLCAIFDVLPQYPVMLKIWFADDEFPASGKMLLNGNADHYLTIEDAVMIGELLLEKLLQRCKEINI